MKENLQQLAIILITVSKNVLTDEEMTEFLGSAYNNICSLAFICQYSFPPCDGAASDGAITQEQCVNIHDDVHVCANEPLQCHYQFQGLCGTYLPATAWVN